MNLGNHPSIQTIYFRAAIRRQTEISAHAEAFAILYVERYISAFAENAHESNERFNSQESISAIAEGFPRADQVTMTPAGDFRKRRTTLFRKKVDAG